MHAIWAKVHSLFRRFLHWLRRAIDSGGYNIYATNNGPGPVICTGLLFTYKRSL